jgi:hypothetical protein
MASHIGAALMCEVTYPNTSRERVLERKMITN